MRMIPVPAAIAILLSLMCTSVVSGQDPRYQLLRDKKYDEAIAECTRRIDSGEGDVKDRAASYWCRGEAFRAGNKTALAIADYGQAIELEPTADRYYARGELFASLWGRDDEAIADFRAASELYKSHGPSNDEWGFRENTAQGADHAARDAARSKTYTSLFVLGILGYFIGRLFRTRIKKSSHGKPSVGSWAVLVASVTVFPYASMRILDALGWMSPLIRCLGTTWGILAGIAIIIAFLILLISIPIFHGRDKEKSPRRPAAATVPTDKRYVPPEEDESGRRRMRCSSCGTLIAGEAGVRFCPRCGDPVNKHGA
jgi:hypothetical protein